MVNGDYFDTEFEVVFPSTRLYAKFKSSGNPKLDRERASLELIEYARQYISENIQAAVSQQEEETV